MFLWMTNISFMLWIGKKEKRKTPLDSCENCEVQMAPRKLSSAFGQEIALS